MRVEKVRYSYLNYVSITYIIRIYLMTFGKKLKKLRTDRGISQQKLSDILEVNRVSISNYEKDKNTPTLSNLNKLKTALNAPDGYFENDNELKVKYIPLIGIASCGIPNMSYNDDIEFIPVEASLARDGVYALKAVGESMTPKIQENDIVICDKEMECNNGNIVHYTTIDGESGIKRYFYDEEKLQVTLSPMNLEYAPLLLSEPDVKVVRAFKIIGDL